MSGGFSNKGPHGGGGGANELTASELLWVQTGSAGVVLSLEGSAPAGTAGYGKIYTKTSNGLLYFKDSAGNEYALVGNTAFEAPTEAVDDSRVVFTFAHTPVYININGGQYFDGAGYTWNAGLMQATLGGPVGSTGFIRGAY